MPRKRSPVLLHQCEGKAVGAHSVGDIFLPPMKTCEGYFIIIPAKRRAQVGQTGNAGMVLKMYFDIFLIFFTLQERGQLLRPAVKSAVTGQKHTVTAFFSLFYGLCDLLRQVLFDIALTVCRTAGVFRHELFC